MLRKTRRLASPALGRRQRRSPTYTVFLKFPTTSNSLLAGGLYFLSYSEIKLPIPLSRSVRAGTHFSLVANTCSACSVVHNRITHRFHRSTVRVTYLFATRRSTITVFTLWFTLFHSVSKLEP